VSPSGPGNALVTGAARRIGRAIAGDLARRGWGVAVHYGTSEAEARALVAEIEAAGGRATALAADLADEGEVQALVPRAARRLGPLRLLVNNASVYERDEALDVTRESWDRHLEVNLRAPLVLSQQLARQLGDGAGLVVNVLDQRVWNPTPHFTSYTVSKAALWTLTRTLALALAPRLRVNAVGPGPVLPSEYEGDDGFRRLCAAMPLRRGVDPLEICRAIGFLLEAPSVTGQMLAVDAGQHLGWILPGQDADLARN
jgi:NAD(P)-dependent dehydrogenase (short-subunit alcohol dehydrogenase family)